MNFDNLFFFYSLFEANDENGKQVKTCFYHYSIFCNNDKKFWGISVAINNQNRINNMHIHLLILNKKKKGWQLLTTGGASSKEKGTTLSYYLCSIIYILCLYTSQIHIPHLIISQIIFVRLSWPYDRDPPQKKIIIQRTSSVNTQRPPPFYSWRVKVHQFQGYTVKYSLTMNFLFVNAKLEFRNNWPHLAIALYIRYTFTHLD